jgi:hypothetical protein
VRERFGKTKTVLAANLSRADGIIFRCHSSSMY